MICAIRLDKTSARSSSTMPLFAILAGAFSFGFLETFSPCLMILLSFVLSYSIGETIHFKEGFLRVVTFEIGFTDEDLAKLPRMMQKHVIPHRHPRVNSMIEADVWFEPVVVIEILGAE